MKCREAGHIPKLQVIEVGDVPGHIIGVVEGAGVLFCDDGSVATTSWKDLFDYIKGGGKHQGYEPVTYEDGSTQWMKYQGTTTPSLDGKTSRWEGSFEFIKGTDRFEGIQGSGSYIGKRLASLPGVGAQYYIDWTFTYTLPSK